MRRLSVQHLAQASGFRHGILSPPDAIAATFADLPGVFNVAIMGDTGSTRDSSAGGFARDPESALAASIGEGLERYAASIARFPLRRAAELGGAELLTEAEFSLFSADQRARRGFPWPQRPQESALYAPVYSLLDNREVWVPEELVGLGSRGESAGAPSTSTGLAAHGDRAQALLSALEELLERDALTVTWLNGLGGRELPLPPALRGPIDERGGEICAFDLTQAFNPHPVVAVAGFLPLRGRRRFSLGAACRPTLAEATDKAFLEFLQGTVFAGYYTNEHPTLRYRSPSEVRDFHAHGVYYTLRPDEWARIPLLRDRTPAARPPADAAPGSTDALLEQLVRALTRAGVRLFYRDLTTPDVRALGVTVVRALSCELSLLHADEQAPFLGGRVRELRWRYPDAAPRGPFPNPLPHPLG